MIVDRIGYVVSLFCSVVPANSGTLAKVLDFISVLALLFLLRNHHGRSSVLAQTKVRPARQTVAVFGYAAENAETDTAHEANIDDVSVAETGGAEVYGDAGGKDEMGA